MENSDIVLFVARIFWPDQCLSFREYLSTSVKYTRTKDEETSGHQNNHFRFS